MSRQTRGSPFTASRYEYEGRHIYYLPSSVIGHLEQPSPAFLIGSRGTGKTTLLRALDWQERLRNESLKRQLGGKAFSGRYIGVYLKLPGIQLDAFDTWLTDVEKETHAAIVGLFLDLSWVDQACLAISWLGAEGAIRAKPEDEHACVTKIMEEYPEVGSFVGVKRPHTVAALGKATCLMRRSLEKLALSKIGAKSGEGPKYFAKEFPVGQVGRFGRSVGKQLADLCNLGNNGEDKWQFKICMDEGESVNTRQLLVINTMVRLAEWPVFPVVAFVSEPKEIGTILKGLTLSRDDRRRVLLDDMDDVEFRELAEGVATVRGWTRANRSRKRYDVCQSLGALDINGLIHRRLSDATSAKAVELRAEARQLAKHPFYADIEVAEGEAGTKARRKAPPYYQAYLVKKLNLALPAPGEPRWRRRQQDSAELRKRIVAAYLSLCKEFKYRVEYAYADMMLQMSDRCIRDFLWQLNELFVATGWSVESFLAKKVPLEKQFQALRRASIAKRDSVPNSEVSTPAMVRRVIDGLARVVAELQQRSPDGRRHLKCSERGIFVVKWDEDKQEESKRVILEAGETGYLRLLKTEGGEWRFRVHASLAAAYEFSYRGAYYDCTVTAREIDALRLASSPEALDEGVEEITRRLQGEYEMPLFEGAAR